MCGIIGIRGHGDVAGRLLDGLRRLEYRGYDSAGVCTMRDGTLERRRVQGKLDSLALALATEPVRGKVGIAHTRWATHGAATFRNAHPHVVGDVALVHNGIIENFRPLRDELRAEGRTFESDTDTEVVAHLISRELERGAGAHDAVSTTLGKLRGAFSFAILCNDEEETLIGARRGSPLVVGFGDGETYLGSDALALAPFTQRVAYLDDGDCVVITDAGAMIHDSAGHLVRRAVTRSGASARLAGKGSYRHYMQKEIFEQPAAVTRTLGSYVRCEEQKIVFPQADFSFAAVQRLSIVACGTSYYAGLIARYWLERYARLPVDVDVASEFRYRQPALRPGGLALFISQSGETADTLAALRHARSQGQAVAAVVNVPTSSMAREADLLLPTRAGPEIGVASTKAFTCQLAVLAALTVKAASDRGALGDGEERALVAELANASAAIRAALNREPEIRQAARLVAPARDVFYLGRGADHVIALEGALKLKEISYIHAEGYAAGEMKHGPIAMIDANVPVVVLAPPGPLFEKTISNMQEVQARGGKIILVSDARGIAEAGAGAMFCIELPPVGALLAPLAHAVVVQLLAYHVAVLKGTDVDQPRNLAKSVTVE